MMTVQTETRTSSTHPIRVDWLPLDIAGRIGLTFAPGKRAVSKYSGCVWKRDLQTDLDRLVDVYGAEVLVSLIEDHDLATYGIPNLFEEARKRLDVWRLPIRDVSTPAAIDEVSVLVKRIVDAANAGRVVVVHCIGGLGRTGTVAGCVLTYLGENPDKALKILREVRGANCPETEAQRRFIRRYADARLKQREAARWF